MDARDKLRVYLEQRRDLGETDLVQDSMSVEDVMKMLGALRSGRSFDARPTPRQQAGMPLSDWRQNLASAEAVQPAPLTLRETAGTSGLSIDMGTDDIFNSELMGLESLDAIAERVDSCTRCPLYTNANKSVPGTGDPRARLVCVGEAPGANEDETGLPFVGAAGNLLTKILAAVDLPREQVFITNVVKHRPPGNRNPAPDEIAACSPYLVRQLQLIGPKVIVAFGTFAAQTLLNTKTPIGKLRGEIHRYHGIPLVVTYHPAALLRNPAWKRPTWEDVKLARRILDSAAGA
jgi:DNA polymerase